VVFFAGEAFFGLAFDEPHAATGNATSMSARTLAARRDSRLVMRWSFPFDGPIARRLAQTPITRTGDTRDANANLRDLATLAAQA